MITDEPDDTLAAELRAAYAPPPAAAFLKLGQRIAHGAPRQPRWPLLLAAAAALVVGMVAWLRTGPPAHDGKELGAMWATAYAHALENGFGGGSCCAGPINLGSVCASRCGTALQLATAAHVQVHGSYCGLPTGGCVVLLGEHDGAPICVCVLPSAQDTAVELPVGSKLQLARRDLGDLVLYALASSAPGPALAAFSIPQH